MPEPDQTPSKPSPATASGGGAAERAPAPPSESPERGGRTPWRVEPAPDGRGGPPPEPPMRRMRWRLPLIVLGLLLLNTWIATLLPDKEPPPRVAYTPFFLEQVERGNVKEISSKGDEVQGKLKKAADPPGKVGRTTEFRTTVPAFANTDRLSNLLQSEDVEVNARSPVESRSFVENLLLSLLPTILLIGLLFWLFRRMGSGGLGGIGRSRARRIEPTESRTSFADVAGIDEAKEELVEIVDFLRNPDRYRRLGARIPRGVLLAGPPGTGKTLLARAVAGEAGAPFFSASAAEFIEMIVGVGASRVRDLFEQAKKAAPAIIFIDELDAIGRARGAGPSVGGHNEGEQTLNQILTEMDGFDPTIGVIVLGATNRPEVLDPALMRPGRFDRRVAVQPPDKVGRQRILEVHTRSVPLADDADLGALASTTQGMVGADLANLVNEAALLAARRGRERVAMADFNDALEKIVLGSERKVVQTRADLERTAYHESGHAITGMLTPGADPVRKVSIIPRGMALGVVFSAPDADRYSYDREHLVGKIKVALGGRVAEKLVYGQVTTGPESDIQQLTQIARGMVTRWGMSDVIGPVAVDGREATGNPFLPGAADTSQRTQQLVDEEVRRIVEQAEAEVTELLTTNRDKLDSLVAALMERETLDGPDAYEAAGIEPPPRPLDETAALPA